MSIATQTKHIQVQISVGGVQVIEVDERMARLVTTLNRPGFIPTIYSCQGDESDFITDGAQKGKNCSSAYVMFGCDDWRQMATFLFDIILPVVKSVIAENKFSVGFDWASGMVRGRISFVPSALPVLTQAFENYSTS